MHEGMSQHAILSRVAQGQSDEDDAVQLHQWLTPSIQEMVVKAYLALMCNEKKAQEYLALDLRQGLAKILVPEVYHEIS